MKKKMTEETHFFQDKLPKINAWDEKTIWYIFKTYKSETTRKWAKIISFAGDPRLWGIILPVLGIYGLIIQDMSLTIVFLMGFLQSYAIYYVFKKGIKRPRPFVVLPDIQRLDKTGHGYSFPSGHTHHSIILVGLLWLSFYPKPAGILILFAYSLAIGFSRMISGCHYPSDIIFAVIEGNLAVFFYWFVTKQIYLTIYWFFHHLFLS